jgi:ssDNA-specific exonuclease RecJ
VINHLKKNNDNLITQFTKKELDPIIKNNYYHSPEISDDENKIIVQDLPWRSDTVSKFIKCLIKIGCPNSFFFIYIYIYK